MQKKHVVSHANIPSEQIVCTPGLSVAHLSLTFTSFSFNSMLSFPPAPDTVYLPKASRTDLKIKQALWPKSLHFSMYWNRQNKTCATTSSKARSSKTKDNSTEFSLKFHFTSWKSVGNKPYRISFWTRAASVSPASQASTDPHGTLEQCSWSHLPCSTQCCHSCSALHTS